MQAILKYRINPEQTPYSKLSQTLASASTQIDAHFDNSQLEWLIQFKPWALDNESLRDKCMIICAVMLRVSEDYPKYLANNSWWSPIPNPYLINFTNYGFTNIYFKCLVDLLTIYPIDWTKCPYLGGNTGFLKSAPFIKQKGTERYFAPKGWQKYPLQISINSPDQTQAISEEDFRTSYGNWYVAYYPCTTE